ncbi:MAG TPA: LuxR C-terminal-related transcriptional regulator [Tepidiformaceae bacterium]|nr:LuxR C-terminal-related transcriptional regulator [Tepidiformaceae bacterium]
MATGGRVDALAISPPNGLLGQMVQALVSAVCDVVDFEVTRAHVLHDCGAIRVTRVDTGRWLCVIPEGVIQTEMPLVLSEGCAAVLTLRSTASDFGRSLETLGESGAVFIAEDLVHVLAEAFIAAQKAQGQDSRHSSTVDVPRLTCREREVLRLVAAGQSNTEIAETLTISTHTVRSHLQSLAEKLNACSRTKIVARGRALGLDEAPGQETALL